LRESTEEKQDPKSNPELWKLRFEFYKHYATLSAGSLAAISALATVQSALATVPRKVEFSVAGIYISYGSFLLCLVASLLATLNVLKSVEDAHRADRLREVSRSWAEALVVLLFFVGWVSTAILFGQATG